MSRLKPFLSFFCQCFHKLIAPFRGFIVHKSAQRKSVFAQLRYQTRFSSRLAENHQRWWLRPSALPAIAQVFSMVLQEETLAVEVRTRYQETDHDTHRSSFHDWHTGFGWTCHCAGSDASCMAIRQRSYPCRRGCGACGDRPGRRHSTGAGSRLRGRSARKSSAASPRSAAGS